jgi:putative inorganic carbon (hco3(-)) transporter
VANLAENHLGTLEKVQRTNSRQNALLGAFAALSLFMVIYCARPEDWIPGLAVIPLAKITGALALIGLVFSLGNVRTRLPIEVWFLVLLIGQLFLTVPMSPVWKGGAFQTTLQFSNVVVIVIVMTLAVNSAKRLRQLVFIQAASVAAIAGVTIWKGRSLGGRLEGMLGGYYSNPNDLALAIVISLPLCLPFLFLTDRKFSKVAWAFGMLVMTYAIFVTGSRGGFVALVCAAVVCLWEFAIRGRRRYLLVVTAVTALIFWQFSSDTLRERLEATFNPAAENQAKTGLGKDAYAYGSAQERKELFWRSIDVTEEHPLFGVGPGNFEEVSGHWRETHNGYSQISSEGGVPAFILYVLILWSGFRNIRETKRLRAKNTELIMLAGGLRASLVAYVVGSVFNSAAYQFFPYFLVAYTTALFSIAKDSALGSECTNWLEGPYTAELCQRKAEDFGWRGR